MNPEYGVLCTGNGVTIFSEHSMVFCGSLNGFKNVETSRG